MGASGTHAERRCLAELKLLFQAAEGRTRVEGFVTSTSRAGEVAVHALFLTLAAVLLLGRPAAAVVVTVVALASLLLEARRGPVLGSLYPRQRAYNLLLRRGEGARRVLAVAFVDPRRLADSQVWRARVVVGATGAGLLVLSGVALAGLELPMVFRVAPAVSCALLSLVLLVMARSERTEPFAGEGLERLLDLLEAQAPPDSELVLAACSGSHPRLEGLRALVDQHPEWRGPETRWLPLDPTGRAGRWLFQRGLNTLQLEEARALIGYAAPDALDLDQPQPGGEPDRAGDELGG